MLNMEGTSILLQLPPKDIKVLALQRRHNGHEMDS
jgi:hypothetical protein